MNAQLLSKGSVVACLTASCYGTLHLLSIYVEAVTGQLHGAGAAQWQFAFLTAPLPALLAILAFVIGRFSRPSLSLAWTLPSFISAAVPILLFSLVFFHVY
jgi:hypothetical protein